MADLNTLLRWAVENSTATQPGASGSTPSVPVGDGMTLKFKPAAPGQQASDNAATLHPSDSQFPIADLSPASTPGPGTPATVDTSLPGQTAANSTLSTEILDLIMGKPDSLTMKEKMAYAVDTNNSVEDRVEALDDFEMLVELIDNANNMAVLKLWEPLLSLFKSEHAEIVRHALWIAGTAAQNNLKAQAALFVSGAFPLILDQLEPAVPAATRAKALYALSAALKHWPLAAAALSAHEDRGYKALAGALSDPAQPVLRRKAAFLLATLTAQARDAYAEADFPGEVRALLEKQVKAEGGREEDLAKGLARTGVYAAAVKGLQEDAAVGDVEFEENAMRALSRAGAMGVLSMPEWTGVKGVWDKWNVEGRKERGLDGVDGEEVSKAMA